MYFTKTILQLIFKEKQLMMMKKIKIEIKMELCLLAKQGKTSNWQTTNKIRYLKNFIAAK